VGIDRGGRDVAVAEQDLHNPGIDAVLKEPSRIAMAQCVWRDALCDPGREGRGSERAAQHLMLDRLGAAASREKPARIAVGQPKAAELGQDGRWQRHMPLLVAFADNAKQHVGAVDRSDFQARGLADAQTARIHDDEARLVDGIPYAAQQGADLCVGKDVRQTPVLRRPNLFSPNSAHVRLSVRR